MRVSESGRPNAIPTGSKIMTPEPMLPHDSTLLDSHRPRVAVVGAGAVGGYFGGMLARAGVPVTLIGRPSLVEAVQRTGLHLETLTFRETIPIEASSDMSAARGADIVLICVKTTETETAAAGLAPFLSPRTIVLSLQNGVDNVRQLQGAFHAVVLPAVVYLASSVPQPGHVKHTGRGDLIIGPTGAEATRLKGLFQHAGIPCRVSEDIQGNLWEKFTCNCALNAISALCQKTYGEVGEHPESWQLAEAVIQETLLVASAAGIIPSNMGDLREATATVRQLTRQIPAAYSSTAQDLRRRKPTEIDSLNGYIARRGRELGIDVPANRTLHALVKLAEAVQPARDSDGADMPRDVERS
jgi:2-dehydropantoate 2-reductase